MSPSPSPPERIDEYRERLIAGGIDCTEVANHDDSEWGISRRPSTPVSSSGRSTSRTRTASFSSSPAGSGCRRRRVAFADSGRRRSHGRRSGTPGSTLPRLISPRHGETSIHHDFKTRPLSPDSARCRRTRPRSDRRHHVRMPVRRPRPGRRAGHWDGTTGDWWTVFALVPDVLDHSVKGFGLYQCPHRLVDPRLRELGQIRVGWARQPVRVHPTRQVDAGPRHARSEDHLHPSMECRPGRHLRRRRARHPKLDDHDEVVVEVPGPPGAGPRCTRVTADDRAVRRRAGRRGPPHA